MFTNSTIQSNITRLNGNSFSWLVGFGIYSSFNSVYYYLLDYGASKVYILNDQWSFISYKVFNQPCNMITIGNSLYMTGDYNVWKLDKDLNILIEYNPSGYPSYRAISYNPSNGFIYVAANTFSEIQVINLNLTLIRRVSTSPRQPWPITILSNQLYVGTWEGIILVYENEMLINQFNGCNENRGFLTSILFDPNGYMATTCYLSNKLYLFSSNGSFTNKSITTHESPWYIGFDTKDRFIQISLKQITIFN